MLRSLLIANRGEIAARIARTARRLGVESIAVASDADRQAPHTRVADRVVAIGGERAADSYLRIDRIVAAALSSGAAAVHPGYGFLSENAALAEAVAVAGLVWIGPPPEAMRAMADKSEARRRMAAAGVPVLPGYDGADQDPGLLQREAARIGFPIMVKAAAGGGGRGMRLVREPGALAEALASAGAEAAASFGDARLLLERAVGGARHVEIQVFADRHGRTIQLGERDCSVQRRHQKIIEEAPSPAVSPALRRRMGDAAVAVARAVGYVAAGTVEFLLDAEGAFWFIEMNTRLQVEHAVTEALLGLDLVEWQLRVAAGEALPLAQDEALARYEAGGHAIEARLCAEDPGDGYLPQSGRIVRWSAPPLVRCDHQHLGLRQHVLELLGVLLDEVVLVFLDLEPVLEDLARGLVRHRAVVRGELVELGDLPLGDLLALLLVLVIDRREGTRFRVCQLEALEHDGGLVGLDL